MVKQTGINKRIIKGIKLELLQLIWSAANISLGLDISPLTVFSSSLSNRVEFLLILSKKRKFTIDRGTLNNPCYPIY